MIPRFEEGEGGNGAGPAQRRGAGGANNRWPAGQQQAQQPVDEEAARRSRQRVFQMGLVVCLVLLFIDQKNAKDPYPTAGSGSAGQDGVGKTEEEIAREGGIPAPKAQLLNTFLAGQKGDGFLYPKNATGYYRGSWSRLPDMIVPPGLMNHSSVPSGHVVLTHSEGRFDMQLYMNAVRDVEGLSLLYGYFKLLDGSHSSERDIYSVAKGVYLHKTGRILLRTMTQADANTIAFTFTMPESAGDGGGDKHGNGTVASRTMRAVFGEDGRGRVEEVSGESGQDGAGVPPEEGAEGGMMAFLDRPEQREDTAVQSSTSTPKWEQAAMADDSGLGITTVDETDGAAAATAGESTVLIPNRSRNQYIRQTTTNGRKCVFQLDATTGPRLEASNTTGPDSQEMGQATLEQLKWVDDIHGVLYSPNCLVAMNITSEAMRLDWGKAYRKAVNYSIVVTMVCVLQIALLFRQLYYSRTQAAASRVSLLTIGQQAILDALLCIAHLLLCAMLQPLFAAFASIAFFKLVIFSIFEIRYMFIIHQSRSSQSVNAANFNNLRRQLATLHARFYAILFLILFLIYFLANYLEVIIFMLYSFWMPQIVVNAVKGTRQPLNRTYVLGMSATRLIIPLYVYGCPQNFIHLLFTDYKPDYRMCVLLVLWVALQVVALLSQDIFGPQYMIPARFLPPKYNYYRPLPQSLRRSSSDATDDGADIELTGPDVENANLPECVICYNNIDVNSAGYMIAPCDHLFHRECLERWMDIRLACPVCRSSLPAP